MWSFIKYYFVLLLYSVVNGDKFNLLLSQDEVKQLLGLDKELYYVKDGQINQVWYRFGTRFISWTFVDSVSVLRIRIWNFTDEDLNSQRLTKSDPDPKPSSFVRPFGIKIHWKGHHIRMKRFDYDRNLNSCYLRYLVPTIRPYYSTYQVNLAKFSLKKCSNFLPDLKRCRK